VICIPAQLIVPNLQARLATFLINFRSSRHRDFSYTDYRVVFSRHLDPVQQLRISDEMKRSAGRFLIFIGTFTLALLPSLANAAPSTDELCERLYAEYLTKAQKALAEEKLEEALRFLLEAQAVAQKCADSAERPPPQKQLRESDHAFAGQHNELS